MGAGAAWAVFEESCHEVWKACAFGDNGAVENHACRLGEQAENTPAEVEQDDLHTLTLDAGGREPFDRAIGEVGGHRSE